MFGERRSGPELSSTVQVSVGWSTFRLSNTHHGTFPSDLDIETFRACATSFFEENTPLVFGVAFGQVSLADLVTPDSAAAMLKQAQVVVATDPLMAATEAAKAYKEMIGYHTSRLGAGLHPSPFYFGRSLTFLSAFHMNLDRGKFADYVDAMRESVELIRGAMETLTLGIDYLKYARFKSLVHGVHKFAGRPEWVVYTDGASDPPSQEDAQFCIDFVVESAIALEQLGGSTPGSAARA